MRVMRVRVIFANRLCGGGVQSVMLVRKQYVLRPSTLRPPPCALRPCALRPCALRILAMHIEAVAMHMHAHAMCMHACIPAGKCTWTSRPSRSERVRLCGSAQLSAERT